MLGDDGARTFFDRLLDVFVADEDAAFLASLGLDHVRLPVNYRHLEDDMRPFELIEDGFSVLDRAIERSWIHGLVRHILFAEPMVDDFARCFDGVRGDEVLALADSFRFRDCVPRARLVEIVRRFAARP